MFHTIGNQTSGDTVLRNYRKDGTMFFNELFILPMRVADAPVNCFKDIGHLRFKSDTLGFGA